MADIEYVTGDLLEAAEACILHGCNARGAFGRGVAGAIRKRWPDAYHVYKDVERHHGLTPGDIIWADVDTGCPHMPVRTIVHCITQQGYGNRGVYIDMDALETCLRKVEESMHPSLADGRVALPMIGAGLGGGDWNEISQVIKRSFVRVQPVVYLLEDRHA